MSSSSGTFAFWTKVSLLTVAACFIAAVPDDNYLVGDLRVPSSDEVYQLSDGILDGALYSESRPKRAPWAPSLTRSEAYLRKVTELTGRGKGKRGSHALQPFGQRDETPFLDAIYLSQYLEHKHPQRRSANQGRSNTNEFTEPSVELVLPEDFYGRWLEGSDPRKGNDNNGDVLVEFVDQSSEPKAKRVPDGRLYIGLGQHAANAALDAFENILGEGKNYRQERLPNPVRFLGRR